MIALGPKNQHPALVISLSVFFGVLASLPVAIVLDVISRSRRRGRGLWAVRHPVRASRSVLSRTLITLEGTLKSIDPGFDLGHEAEEIVAREHREDFGTPEELVKKELVRSLPALRTLPEHAEAIATQLRSGRMVLRTERYTGADRPVVEAWLDSTLVAASGAAGVVASAILLGAGSLTSNRTIRDVIWTLGFMGLTTTSVLLMRTVAQALHAQLTSSD